MPDGRPRRRVRTAAARIDELVRLVPDYPQPGILFRDITPLLADAEAFADVIAEIAAARRRARSTSSPAWRRAASCSPLPSPSRSARASLPVRKAGKLPGPTASQSYELEYGTATIEIHPDTVPAGARVLVIDDVLATGGTAAAHGGAARAVRCRRRRAVVPGRARVAAAAVTCSADHAIDVLLAVP